MEKEARPTYQTQAGTPDSAASEPHADKPERLQPKAHHLRIFSYCVMGLTSSMVPLPWVPYAVSRKVRGALVYDVAAQFRINLSDEARAHLSSPFSFQGVKPHPHPYASEMTKFALSRLLARFGALGLLSPFANVLSTFVIGHLFFRYMSHFRQACSLTIELDEAKRIRSAMESSFFDAAKSGSSSPLKDIPKLAHDSRSIFTKWTDGVLMVGANIPNWFIHKLDDSFEQYWSK